jgi:hypothetical protein
MEKVCKNCKYWHRRILVDLFAENPNPDAFLNVGGCEKIHTKILEEHTDEDNMDVRIIENGKVYCSNFQSHEDFGCIHFKLK